MSQEGQTLLIELALSGLGKQLVSQSVWKTALRSFLWSSLVLLKTIMLLRYIITHLPKRGLKILFIKVKKVDGVFVIPKFITTVS